MLCHLLALAAKWGRLQDPCCCQRPFFLINTSGHTILHLNCECLPSINVISFLYLSLRVVTRKRLHGPVLRTLTNRDTTQQTTSEPSHLFYYIVPCRFLVLPALTNLSLSLHSLRRSPTQTIESMLLDSDPHTAVTCVKLYLEWFANPNPGNNLICGETQSNTAVLSGHKGTSIVSFSQQLFDLQKPAHMYGWHRGKSDTFKLLKCIRHIL